MGEYYLAIVMRYGTNIVVCLVLRQFQILKQSIGKENSEET